MGSVEGKLAATIYLEKRNWRWIQVEAIRHDTSASMYIENLIVEDRKRVEKFESARTAAIAGGKAGEKNRS